MHWPRGLRKQSSKRASPDTELGVADECEAFISGSYAEFLAERGGDVPTWAVLNVLAHTDLDRLRTRAESGLVAELDQRQGWVTASRLLRRELVELVGEDEGLLANLQRTVLIPLELQLARESDTELEPRAVVVSTRAALRSACR